MAPFFFAGGVFFCLVFQNGRYKRKGRCVLLLGPKRSVRPSVRPRGFPPFDTMPCDEDTVVRFDANGDLWKRALDTSASHFDGRGRLRKPSHLRIETPDDLKRCPSAPVLATRGASPRRGGASGCPPCLHRSDPCPRGCFRVHKSLRGPHPSLVSFPLPLLRPGRTAAGMQRTRRTSPRWPC